MLFGMELYMKKRIIIVDDDEGILDIFQIIFQRAGYEVEILAEASKIMNNNFEVPDLFILDKQLSGQDGFVICKFLKNQVATQKIPVIMVSAMPGLKDFHAQAGADAYIEKPFDIKNVLNLVAGLI